MFADSEEICDSYASRLKNCSENDSQIIFNKGDQSVTKDETRKSLKRMKKGKAVSQVRTKSPQNALSASRRWC